VLAVSTTTSYAKSLAEKGGEFGLVHLARGHREGAMVDRAEAARATVDPYVVGRIVKIVAARSSPIGVAKAAASLGLDFSLEVAGFEMAEIDLRIAQRPLLANHSTTHASRTARPVRDYPADDLPELAASLPVRKIGDL
jgi:hypothetical protein